MNSSIKIPTPKQTTDSLEDVKLGLGAAIICCLEAMAAINGSDMLVEKNATQAMDACKLTSSFNATKWPSPTLHIQYEDKSKHRIYLTKGNIYDIIDEATPYSEIIQDFYGQDGLNDLRYLTTQDPVHAVASNEVVMYNIYDPYEKNELKGIFASNKSSSELEDDLLSSCQEDENPERTAKIIFDGLMLALKTLSYASITHFKPEQINKRNKKLVRKLKNKGFNTNNNKLLRVVYLPKVVQKYAKSNAITPKNVLKNGRVGHLRVLHSDYFTHKQGQSILIPPIANDKGQFPKVLYKVRKLKAA